MDIKKVILICLQALFILLMPAMIVLNSLGSSLFTRENSLEALKEKINDDKIVASTIKQVVNERIKNVKETGEGMAIAIFSKVPVSRWIELIDTLGLQPAIINNVEAAHNGFFNWIDNDKTYPDIKFSTTEIFSKVKNKTSYLFDWAYVSMNAPYCDTDQLKNYNENGFGNDLPPLLMCKVPDEMYGDLLQHGAGLIVSRIDSAGIPKEIILKEKLEEELDTDKITEIKSGIRTVSFISEWGWFFVFVILVGLIYALSSGKENFFKSLSAPILISGIAGILFYFIDIGNFIASITVQKSPTMPRAVKNLLSDVFSDMWSSGKGSLLLISLTMIGIYLFVTKIYKRIDKKVS